MGENQFAQRRDLRPPSPVTSVKQRAFARLHARAGAFNARFDNGEQPALHDPVFLPARFLDRMGPCEREGGDCETT